MIYHLKIGMSNPRKETKKIQFKTSYILRLGLQNYVTTVSIKETSHIPLY